MIQAEPRERGIGIGEFEQAHRGVANGEAQAVVIGGFGQRGEPERVQIVEQGRRATEAAQHAYGGDVEGVAQRMATGHRTVQLVVIVLRAVEAGTGLKFKGQIRHDGGGRGTALKRERIGKRFQRRTRRMRHPGAVDLPAIAGEVVARSCQRQHMPGGVVDDHGGGVLHAFRAQPFEPLGDERFHLRLQARLEGGANHGLRGRGLIQQVDGVRCDEATPVALQGDGLGAGNGKSFVRQPAEFMHAGENALLALQDGAGVAKGIESSGGLRQRRQEGTFSRRKIAQRLVEVSFRRCVTSRAEVAITDPVEVGRKNLRLGPAHLQMARAQCFNHFGRQCTPLFNAP